MKETKNLEYKEDLTNSFLKTVSAFANYGEGSVVFGILNDGKVKGVSDIDKTILKIENKINECIKPNPNYKIKIDTNNKVIILTIEEGMFKPYYYNSKAYKRNDTATIEVDRIELNRLILEGNNQSFEELPSKNQDLKFNFLKDLLKKKLSVENTNMDILRTLELYNDVSGYNNAALLLSDNNELSGVDIVRFGDTIDIIKDREDLTNISILEMFNKSISMFDKYYIYEEIKGSDRNKVEIIPEKAFREAIANALVHRTWDVAMNIQISMYDNRVEIVSPGGLYGGLSVDNYLKGMISILRNPIVGNLFFRLNYIEKFGTGIRRITNAYQDSKSTPKFEIEQNFIKIILPALVMKLQLSDEEEAVYNIVTKVQVSSGEIVKESPFGRNKTINILKKLVEDNHIQTLGNGRGKKYYKC